TPCVSRSRRAARRSSALADTHGRIFASNLGASAVAARWALVALQSVGASNDDLRSNRWLSGLLAPWDETIDADAMNALEAVDGERGLRRMAAYAMAHVRSVCRWDGRSPSTSSESTGRWSPTTGASSSTAADRRSWRDLGMGT